jgi:hypothetical protein
MGSRKNKKLIHYDTEQGRFHAQRTFNRVVRMCDDTSQIIILMHLREYSAFERLDFINWHLYNVRKSRSCNNRWYCRFNIR